VSAQGSSAWRALQPSPGGQQRGIAESVPDRHSHVVPAGCPPHVSDSRIARDRASEASWSAAPACQGRAGTSITSTPTAPSVVLALTTVQVGWTSAADEGRACRRLPVARSLRRRAAAPTSDGRLPQPDCLDLSDADLATGLTTNRGARQGDARPRPDRSLGATDAGAARCRCHRRGCCSSRVLASGTWVGDRRGVGSGVDRRRHRPIRRCRGC
jgi:hypothetical protein